MNSMAKQMDMFDEGGLMDEGGTVDPVSGNDVPPGSTQEEVRDDIPAQLSEGEFVFPADVVRYFGLEKLMEMRQEAKMGLQRMEAMGQMGNSEEATLPDDIPFSIEDLDMEEEGEYNTPQEFNVGGVVQMPGTNFTTTPNPGPTTGFRPYVAPPVPGYTPPPIQAGPQYQGIQLPGTRFTGATEKTTIPTFGQTVGTNPGQYDEFRTYVNTSGQTLRIPFKNGQPLYPIPQGYTLQKEDAIKTESTVPTTTVEENEGREGDGDIGGLSSTVGTTTALGTKTATDKEHEAAFGGNVNAIDHAGYRGAVAELAATQFGLTGVGAIANPGLMIGQQMAGAFANTDIGKSLNVPDISFGALNDKATAINQARNSALNALGLAQMSQVTTPAQYDAITAAMIAGKKGTSVSQAIAEHPEAIKAGQVAAMENMGFKSSDLSNPASVAEAIAGYDLDIGELEEALETASDKGGTVTGGGKAISTGTGGTVKTEKTMQLEKEYGKQLSKTRARKDTLSKVATSTSPTFGTIDVDDPAFGIGAAYDDGGYDDSGLGSGPDDASTSTSDSTDVDGMEVGDYKGAFVGETYKKNKLAKQIKRSGLASKK